MTAIMPNVIYTVLQVSEILHCSTRSVYRRIETGKLKGRKQGKVTLIYGADLLLYWEGLPAADRGDDGPQGSDQGV